MFCCKGCQKLINGIKFEHVPNEGTEKKNIKNIISSIENRYYDTIFHISESG